MNQRPGEGPRLLFALACMIFAMGGLTAGAFGVVWIYIEADFSLSLSALGTLFSIATVGRTITSFASGPLMNRFGIAPVLIGGMALSTASMVGFALAPVWLVCLGVAFVHGIGSGVMAAGLNAFAAVHFSARRMNWLHGSFGVGSTIGPLIVTTIVIDLGLAWRWSYGFFVLLRLVVLPVLVLTRDRWRITEGAKRLDRRERTTLLSTARMPLVWLMVGAFMLTTGLELVAGQFANNFLIEARDIDPKIAGAWVSLYWASLTVSRFVVGGIIARIGNGMFLRLCSFGIMLGAALLWSNLGEISGLLGLGLIGFCIAPFAPLMSSDTPGRVGVSHVANAMGLQFTGASLGMAVLPWLAGIMAETWGLEIIPQIVLAFAIAMFLLHEGILWRELRKPLPSAVS